MKMQSDAMLVRGLVELKEENVKTLPEGHVPTSSLPYGYYRQKARQNQAAAEI